MSAVRFAYARTVVVMAVILTTALSATAQTPKPLELKQPLVAKNFYLLSLLQQSTAAQKELAADAALNVITNERQEVMTTGIKSCKEDGVCMIRSIAWTDEEIGAVSRALRATEPKSPALHALVEGSLRSSGAYVLEQGQDDASLLVSAWQIAARGINHVLEVYGEGMAPRYPLIDSLAVDAGSPEYQSWLVAMLKPLSQNTSSLFFEPSLTAAVSLLEKNHRDEAGRMEPMETGINAAALQAASATVWKRYPYTVILVPGAGPGDRETALAADGHERVRMAVEAYHHGDAPFILVSGGYVHPSQTRFAEAVEMKRSLMDEFHVPESAIIEDPHARHTTTNMRNAAREIYRYGIPMDHPALVISDARQEARITSAAFADRCLREMGYVPFRILSQRSPTEAEFLPKVESLEEDPMDPLDP
jgi:uncharacterized SAM-binding protein YcdF (DUF218 family)